MLKSHVVCRSSYDLRGQKKGKIVMYLYFMFMVVSSLPYFGVKYCFLFVQNLSHLCCPGTFPCCMLLGFSISFSHICNLFSDSYHIFPLFWCDLLSPFPFLTFNLCSKKDPVCLGYLSFNTELIKSVGWK